MKFDESQLQLVRTVTTETPGTFAADDDWAGTVTPPEDSLLVPIPVRHPNGSEHVGHLWVGYEILDDGAPEASTAMDVDIAIVYLARVAGSSRRVLMAGTIQVDAAPNTLYKFEVKPGDLVAFRLFNYANVDAQADELRLYIRPV